MDSDANTRVGAPEVTDEELSHYSAALDEIWWLRQALAYEALVIEAQALSLSDRALGKRRKEILQGRVEAMKAAARGEAAEIYGRMSCGSSNLRNAMRLAGADECLTRHDWEHRG